MKRRSKCIVKNGASNRKNSQINAPKETSDLLKMASTQNAIVDKESVIRFNEVCVNFW